MQKQGLGEDISYPEETIRKIYAFHPFDCYMSASFVTGTVGVTVKGLIGTLGRQSKIHINNPDNYR